MKFKLTILFVALISITQLLSSCSSKENELNSSEEASVVSENEAETSAISEQESNDNSISTVDDENKDSLGEKINKYFSENLFSNEYSTFKTSLMNGVSAEGAVVRGYYQNDDLKLIKIQSYGELGRAFWDFYIVDSETTFVIVNKQDYSAGLALEEPEDIYVEKECTKAYVILQDKVYEYDSVKMDIAAESDSSTKEFFDEAVAFLDSSDFVDDPTLW